MLKEAPHRAATRPDHQPVERGSALPGVIQAPRTDAIYNCHAYLTKVPIGAIAPFIEAFTRPDEKVVDMFAGSGMTGLAAASLGRYAELSDISVLGQHIATGYSLRLQPSRIRSGLANVLAEARSDLGDLYFTTRLSDKKEVEQVRTIWSFAYLCPGCAEPFVFFEQLDSFGRPRADCPRCGTRFSKRTWGRSEDLPVRVVVIGEDGKQLEQGVQDADRLRIARAASDARLESVPSLEISNEREMYGRSGLSRAGISCTKQFFSPRNALALLSVWKRIEQVEDEGVKKKLAFAFTACLTRASRRYQWGPKRPLNAQNQTYYIAPVYFEWNVFELFKRKVEAAIRADEMLFDRAPLFAGAIPDRIQYTLASADRLNHLQPDSIDYIFTDPPFGSNIFYSDMNLFHEAWLGRATDSGSEAVIHTSGPRRNGSHDRYAALLSKAFAEAFRVLKPGRFMSVVFGSSSGAVWALVQGALRSAGFSSPVHVAILDKGQRSVKGLNSGSEGVVTVDLVLTVEKQTESQSRSSELAPALSILSADLLSAAVVALDTEQSMNPSYVYAAVVREAINRKVPLDRLHYSDVLMELRNMGLEVDSRTGLLMEPVTPAAIAGSRPG